MLRSRLSPFSAPVSRLTRIFDPRAQRIGNVTVTVLRDVLVDHRRSGAGVAHPLHQLPDRCATLSGEHVPCMSKVMEMDRGQTSLVQAVLPGSSEVLPSEPAAPGSHEDQLLVSGLRERSQVLTELREQGRGNSNATSTGGSLGIPRVGSGREGDLGCAHV
jgi:hypothetical protein